MARKNAPPAPARPSADRVHNLIGRGEMHAAYVAARLLHANEPTPANLALLKKLVQTVATQFLDAGRSTEFNKVMNETEAIDAANPEWVAERACLLARGGRLPDALMRVDESARPRVLSHGADRALWVQSKEMLPDELHAGYDAVVAAFGLYEAGKDDDARAALEPVGLRSPFLEWKVFLRGLMAHAAKDLARAAENFARLDPQRLPYRLAAPYRTVEPGHSATSDLAAKQYARLNASAIVTRLREIAGHLGRDKPLRPALLAAEALLPQLKQQLPDLVHKLGDCLASALIRQGDPADLTKYRTLFAPPPDDPAFFRLQARISEDIGEWEVANRNWRQYESWLATKPAGWPEALLLRVRAHLWHHMGTLGIRDRDDGEHEDEPRQKRQRPSGPPPLECFKRAVELAPDWEIASREYYSELVEEGRHADAEQVGRALLEHHPDSLEPVLALADNLRKQKKPAESLEFLKRARAINPLDKTITMQMAFGVVSLARANLFSGQPDEAEACLDADREVLDLHMPAHRDALRAVIARKRGDRARAAELMAAVDAVPALRLANYFRIAVDSLLAKLKPADRKAADQAFAEELNKPQGPAELVNLLVAHNLYRDAELSYRGQKTQEKKFLALVPGTVNADAPEAAFVALADVLVSMHQDKVARRFLYDCSDRFPASPVFFLRLAELEFENGSEYVLRGWLRTAKDRAEKSKDPHHRSLLPRINELFGQIPDPLAFIDSFFKGKF